jgi:hypothetical protein
MGVGLDIARSLKIRIVTDWNIEGSRMESKGYQLRTENEAVGEEAEDNKRHSWDGWICMLCSHSTTSSTTIQNPEPTSK